MLVHAEALLDISLYEIRPGLAKPLRMPVEPPQGGSVDPRRQVGFPRPGHWGSVYYDVFCCVTNARCPRDRSRRALARPLLGRAASDGRPADGAGAASRP